MKIQSLKGMFILGALTLILPACRQSEKDRLVLAVHHDEKGALFQTEKNWDSAIANYYKSYLLYELLDMYGQPPHQINYASKSAQLAYKLACCYELTHDYDKAAIYATFSYNGSKSLMQTDSCITDEILIAYYDLKAAKNKVSGSDSQGSYYTDGINHITSACSIIEGFGWDTAAGKNAKIALSAFTIAHAIFNVTGDSVKAQFYAIKYNELLAKTSGHAPENM
jgi:hypothetical protein